MPPSSNGDCERFGVRGSGHGGVGDWSGGMRGHGVSYSRAWRSQKDTMLGYWTLLLVHDQC